MYATTAEQNCDVIGSIDSKLGHEEFHEISIMSSWIFVKWDSGFCKGDQTNDNDICLSFKWLHVWVCLFNHFSSR